MISDFPVLRLALFVGMLVLMFLIETYKPVRSWFDRRSDRIKFSVGLAIVNNAFMRLLIVAPFLLLSNWVDEQGWGLSSFLGLSGVVEIVTTIVLFDFLDAVKHKWFHRVPFMWRFHRVHHTDRSLDILTALRYHPGELLISAVIKAGWIFLWGPSALAFAAFEIVLNVSSQFHHSNIHLGRIDSILNRFIVTPRYHAIHHTINRARGDQNFTTIFSIWDRILGTYADPQKTVVDLERLNDLQDHHLSLWNVLRSPIVSPHATGKERLQESVYQSESEYLANVFGAARESIKSNRALLVDVREDSERKRDGAIRGAVIFPYHLMGVEKLDEIERMASNDKSVFVFCRAGVRAQKIVDHLKRRGLDAKNLGGFVDCVNNGLDRPIDVTRNGRLDAPVDMPMVEG